MEIFGVLVGVFIYVLIMGIAIVICKYSNLEMD
jgi:hypothetical protein